MWRRAKACFTCPLIRHGIPRHDTEPQDTFHFTQVCMQPVIRKFKRVCNTYSSELMIRGLFLESPENFSAQIGMHKKTHLFCKADRFIHFEDIKRIMPQCARKVSGLSRKGLQIRYIYSNLLVIGRN